jgi:hypothetical protein
MKALYAAILLASLALTGCAAGPSEDLRYQPHPPGWDDELYYTRQVTACLEQQPNYRPDMVQ